jgi:hypothetical protein
VLLNLGELVVDLVQVRKEGGERKMPPKMYPSMQIKSAYLIWKSVFNQNDVRAF